jgi:riboflavin kinase/FMN adenylyltransferase
MKIHHILQNTTIQTIDQGVVVALGFFDGVHLAHQDLIHTTIQTAKEHGKESGIVTFYPKPSFVLQPSQEESYLTPLEVKAKICETMGIDHLFVIEFSSEVAKLSPRDFVQQYLIPLGVHLVVAGDDNRYGAKGAGSIRSLAKDADGKIQGIEFQEQTLNGVRISASLIRQHLRDGQVELAKLYLGRAYRVDGRVVYGKGRGKLIGIPTANIALRYPYLIPKGGVYAVKLIWQNQAYDGVCNIGYNPTFGANNNQTVEVHVLAFSKALYDEYVEVEFYQRIRNEQTFSGPDALVAQIHQDIEVAKTIFTALQSSYI